MKERIFYEVQIKLQEFLDNDINVVKKNIVEYSKSRYLEEANIARAGVKLGIIGLGLLFLKYLFDSIYDFGKYLFGNTASQAASLKENFNKFKSGDNNLDGVITSDKDGRIFVEVNKDVYDKLVSALGPNNFQKSSVIDGGSKVRISKDEFLSNQEEIKKLFSVNFKIENTYVDNIIHNTSNGTVTISQNTAKLFNEKSPYQIPLTNVENGNIVIDENIYFKIKNNLESRGIVTFDKENVLVDSNFWDYIFNWNFALALFFGGGILMSYLFRNKILEFADAYMMTETNNETLKNYDKLTTLGHREEIKKIYKDADYNKVSCDTKVLAIKNNEDLKATTGMVCYLNYITSLTVGVIAIYYALLKSKKYDLTSIKSYESLLKHPAGKDFNHSVYVDIIMQQVDLHKTILKRLLNKASNEDRIYWNTKIDSFVTSLGNNLGKIDGDKKPNTNTNRFEKVEQSSSKPNPQESNVKKFPFEQKNKPTFDKNKK